MSQNKERRIELFQFQLQVALIVSRYTVSNFVMSFVLQLIGILVQDETGEFDSANSKEKLVTRWLGRHHSPADAAAAAATARAGPAPRIERIERGERAERRGVRKQRPRPPPVVLLPAHPASTVSAYYISATTYRKQVTI